MAINEDYDVEIEEYQKVKREIKKKDGEILVFYTQRAWLNVGRRNDIEFSIPLTESAPPFPIGKYRFVKRNCLFTVSEYGNLQISREILYANVEFPLVIIPKDK